MKEEIKLELSIFRQEFRFIANMLDGFLHEILTTRTEHSAQTERISALVEEVDDHEDRILKLERKIFM